MTTLWGGDPETVKRFVADQFDHIDEFSEGAITLGMLEPTADGSMVLMGGIVLELRRCGWDGEVSIVVLPGVTLTRANLRTMFSVPFEAVGLARLTCLVAKKNKRSRRFVERLGFTLEGAMKRGFDGHRTACIYGMTREDCRWIDHGLDAKAA